MRLNSGELLKALMKTKDLSNADVGAHARVGRTFISALTNGRKTSCTPRVAELIAERLEVPLEVLFTPKASAVSGRIVSGQRKDVAA